MTPAEYIRRMRVEALHQALLDANGGQSVTDLMRAVGIMNFGRYAHYYRQQVGVAPSVTLKRNKSHRPRNSRSARPVGHF